MVASAGTHDYHVGKPAFPTAVEVAKKRGIDITSHVARRISPGDFDQYDLILAMDKANIANLRAIAPTRSKRKIELLLEYGDKYHGLEVPDPVRRRGPGFRASPRHDQGRLPRTRAAPGPLTLSPSLSQGRGREITAVARFFQL